MKSLELISDTICRMSYTEKVILLALISPTLLAIVVCLTKMVSRLVRKVCNRFYNALTTVKSQ